MTKFSEIYLENFEKNYHFLTKFSEIYLEIFLKKMILNIFKIYLEKSKKYPAFFDTIFCLRRFVKFSQL